MNDFCGVVLYFFFHIYHPLDNTEHFTGDCGLGSGLCLFFVIIDHCLLIISHSVFMSLITQFCFN